MLGIYFLKSYLIILGPLIGRRNEEKGWRKNRKKKRREGRKGKERRKERKGNESGRREKGRKKGREIRKDKFKTYSVFQYGTN